MFSLLLSIENYFKNFHKNPLRGGFVYNINYSNNFTFFCAKYKNEEY